MIPVPSHPAITTPYGKEGSWSGGVHGGADFGSSGVGGATVVAPWGGTVIGVRNPSGSYGTTWGSAYGYHVVIDYDKLPDGSAGLWGNVAHLKDVAVSVGQRVEAGQVIGHVNSTGNSTGDHAHAEIQRAAGWQSGNHVKPQPWFNAQSGGSTPPPSSGDCTTAYPAPTSGLVYVSKLRQGQRDSDSAWYLQRALNGHSLVAPGNVTLPLTGCFLDQTATVVQADQHQHGFGNDPMGSVYVGPSQASHLFAGSGLTIIDDR
jgi:biotin carboxyl carrier protein